jgi:hypothetical protein
LARFFKPDISSNQTWSLARLLSFPENQPCKFLQCGGMENNASRKRRFAKIVI